MCAMAFACPRERRAVGAALSQIKGGPTGLARGQVRARGGSLRGAVEAAAAAVVGSQIVRPRWVGLDGITGRPMPSI